MGESYPDRPWSPVDLFGEIAEEGNYYLVQRDDPLNRRSWIEIWPGDTDIEIIQMMSIKFALIEVKTIGEGYIY